jgi:hypothetical protein
MVAAFAWEAKSRTARSGMTRRIAKPYARAAVLLNLEDQAAT